MVERNEDYLNVLTTKRSFVNGPLAFASRHDEASLRRWLRTFVTRFFDQQYKRSTCPDGPKVGSVSLSPRGDWRMPSDASKAAWLAELE